MPSCFRRASTIPGFLVLLAFCLIIGGLLLPVIQLTRISRHRLQCTENLRKIGVGATGYADTHGVLPRNEVRPPRHSWNTEILPYIGEEKLARLFSPDHEWWDNAASNNRNLASKQVATFLCPAAPHPKRLVLTKDPNSPEKSFPTAATDYVGSAGAYYENNDPDSLHVGAMHHRKVNQRIRIADIPDGTTNTLFVVEMADKPNRWQAGKLSDDRLTEVQMPALAGQ
ncbi:MAG: DUF1559 domain-containing protein [Zavarzinella sp.]